MSRLKAAIAGCGRIGALFDAPGSPEVLTHAHAYHEHPDFEIVAFADTEAGRAERAAALWGGHPYRSLAQALAAERIDVVSVCAPTKAHAELLEQLADAGVRAVFAEKPLTDDPQSGRRAIGRLRQAGVPVLVNYTRRFVGEFARVRDAAAAGAWGRYLSGCGYYGKGILNNGSHLVDLVRFLLGEIVDWRVLSGRNDAGPEDPTVSVALQLEGGGLCHLLQTDHRCYTLLELDLLFENRRVRITDAGFGLEESVPAPDPVWPGYRRLQAVGASRTSYGRALLAAVGHLERVLRGVEEPLCTMEDAWRAQRICLDIAEAWRGSRR